MKVNCRLKILGISESFLFDHQKSAYACICFAAVVGVFAILFILNIEHGFCAWNLCNINYYLKINILQFKDNERINALPNTAKIQIKSLA